MHSISGDMEQDEILNLNETGFLKPKSKKNPYLTRSTSPDVEYIPKYRTK